MNRKQRFNKFLADAAASGTYVGDINQATTAFDTGVYPTNPSSNRQELKPPDPIQPTPAPRKIGDKGGSRLKIRKKAKRSRGQLSGGTSNQRIALNTPASNAGGVNIGGG